jgi:hypothetical protein
MIEPNIHDAIRSIYLNVVTISGNDFNSLTCLDQNGVEVTIVPETIIAELSKLQDDYVTQQTTQLKAKASAIAKLTALGLTDIEIISLTQ